MNTFETVSKEINKIKKQISIVGWKTDEGRLLAKKQLEIRNKFVNDFLEGDFGKMVQLELGLNNKNTIFKTLKSKGNYNESF